MGKQKTVTTGKPPGRPRGGAKGGSRGGGRPKGRASKSATPAPSTLSASSAPEAVPDRPGPKLLLKSSVGRSDSPAQERDATPGYGASEDQDDDLPQQSGEAAPVTTRTGRAVNKPNQYDAAQGSEIDAFIDQAEEDARGDGKGSIASDPCECLSFFCYQPRLLTLVQRIPHTRPKSRSSSHQRHQSQEVVRARTTRRLAPPLAKQTNKTGWMHRLQTLLHS